MSPDRALVSRDISRSEAVEADLTRLIEKRDEKRRESEGERLERELWQEIAEREDAKDQSRRTWEWIRFHEDQAERAERNAAEIAARNRARADALRLRVGAPAELEERA